MSLKITTDCINCGVCEEECPNSAISPSSEEAIYIIDHKRCTECVGHFDEPSCIPVCPVDCILIGVEESKDDLLVKFQKLSKDQTSED